MAGVWTVVLAVALGVAGLALAVQQARALSAAVMSEAEARVRNTATAIDAAFDRQLRTLFNRVAVHVRTNGLVEWTPGAFSPSWFDGVYAWDGRAFAILRPASMIRDRIANLAAERLLGIPPGRLGGLYTNEPQIVHESIGTRPIIFALQTVFDESGRSVLIAGRVDHKRLKRDLLDRMVPSDGQVELVPVGRASRWSQSLGSAMRFWVIQPTETFRTEQRNAVVYQAITYVGLTLLALGTLVAAMLFLIRTARRGIALAEMKSYFVADVSHELKTPLALIRMFCETLQAGRVASEEKRKEYYDIITRESVRLTHLIDNILDFARIEAGKKKYAFEPADVATVARDTYEAYRHELDHKGFEHEFAAGDDLPLVRMDRDAISQVILNLISNSVKYSDEEKYLGIEVTRDTRRGRRGVLILVRDRGIGVAAEDRRHLFEGFYRANDGRVRQRGGAGLGLALVKHIVDTHDGLIDVESRLVKGTTFRIFLPAAEDDGDEATEAPGQAVSGHDDTEPPDGALDAVARGDDVPGEDG